MPDLQTLQIAAGAMKGLETATNNIYKISVARKEMERQKKIDDITLKQHGLEIQKLEGELSPEMVQLHKDALKAKAMKDKVDYTAAEHAMNNADAEAKMKREVTSLFLDNIKRKLANTGDNAIDLSSAIPENYTLKGEGGLSVKGTAGKTYKPNKSTADALSALGKYNDQESAMESISKNRKQLKFDQVDIGYLKSKVQELLPKKQTIQNTEKKVHNGLVYEKRNDGQWYAISLAPEYTEA